jgi:GNAT superfamily N-acetyltransferase
MTADYATAVREHQVDLLHLDGRLAALIELIDGADHLLIENIAVATACQASGLGAKLLAHAELVAKSRGCSTLKLYTNKLFGENVRFYLARGYVIDREEEFTGGST